MANKKNDPVVNNAPVNAGVDAATSTPAQDETPKVSEPVKVDLAPRKLDETVPGGRYIVNGVLVDCNGKRIEDSDEKEKG